MMMKLFKKKILFLLFMHLKVFDKDRLHYIQIDDIKIGITHIPKKHNSLILFTYKLFTCTSLLVGQINVTLKITAAVLLPEVIIIMYAIYIFIFIFNLCNKIYFSETLTYIIINLFHMQNILIFHLYNMHICICDIYMYIKIN